MSRIGKSPVQIPEKVSVNIDGLTITVKGPKGELKRLMPDGVDFVQKENQIVVNEENKEYIIDNPWKTVIQEFIDRPQNHNRELTTELVLTEAIEKPVERQNRYDQMQCANILKELGYEKRRRGGRAGRKWVYIRDLERV